MNARTPIRGRLAELLAAEAADDIGAEERAELERLAAQAPAAGREQMMEAAGLAQLAFLKRDGAAPRALPAALSERLARQGAAWQAGRQATAAAPVAEIARARRRRDGERQSAPVARTVRERFPNLGWYTAAALALAVVVARLLPAPAPGVVATAAADRRVALIEQAPDLVRVAWSVSAEPGYAAARGDVVWSSARQEGYLRLTGLPANDREREQYQLWVVDPERDARPVDGGVFDIAGDGESVIPIQAKLPVGRPAAFAITLEKAGGAVVSDGPMLLVAAVGG